MGAIVRYSDSLMHYGKKGMHWGDRKYQNEDGSLTPLGRIHYGVGQGRDRAKAAITSMANKAKDIGSTASSKAKAASVRVKRFSSDAANKISPKLKTAGTAAAKGAAYGAKVGLAAGAGALALTGGAVASAAAKRHNAKIERREIRKEQKRERHKKQMRKLAVKAALGTALAVAGMGAYAGSKIADAHYKKKRDKHFTEVVKQIEDGLKKKAGEMGIENPTAIQGLKGYKFNPRRGPLRADMTSEERYDWWVSVLMDEPEYQEAVNKQMEAANKQQRREDAYWEMANDPNYHGTASDINAELDRREEQGTL